MPTYDYHCNACGADLEIFHSMTQSAKRKCPECGKLKLERRIGAGGGILFRGSGFYETDYRSESYRKGADAEKSSGSDSSKSPSKPPSKSSSKSPPESTSKGGDAKSD